MTRRQGPAIGLFGGSFNPAHGGHLHVAQAGLRELALDQVWWLISPQNPLKPVQPPARERASTIARLGLPMSMRISHIESEYGTRYTVDLLRQLTARHPAYRFVYMIGADNLAQIHRWKDWTVIFETVPVAVIARPGAAIKARLSLAARRMAGYRIDETHAHSLKDQAPPAWTYLTLPFNPLSSSAIRAAAKTSDLG